MKKWQIENSEKSKISEISEKIFPSFLTSEFSILPYSQNRKLVFKNLGKKFEKFLRFPGFPSFRPGRNKICFWWYY